MWGMRWATKLERHISWVGYYSPYQITLIKSYHEMSLLELTEVVPPPSPIPPPSPPKPYPSSYMKFVQLGIN